MGQARLQWRLALLAMIFLLLAPLATVEIPPLLDYPNHLARLYVLAHPADPILSRMFRANWSIIPNIAIDFLALPLLHVLPLYVAGKLILATTILMPVAGILAYARASFGRVSWWQLGAGLVVFHALVLMGFLNFSLSIGLSLLLASLWVAWREAHPLPSLGLAIAAAFALFFFHIFSLVFYLVLIGASELSRLIDTWQDDRRRLSRDLCTRAGGLLIVALVPVILSLLSPVGDVHDTVTHWGVWPRKVKFLTLPFLNYDWRVDVPIGLAVLVSGAYLIRRRQLAVSRPALIGVAMLIVIYFICPRSAMDTAFIQDRWPVMIGLMLFAGASSHDVPGRPGRIVFCCLAVLFLVKMAIITAVWISSPDDVAQMRQIIAPVPPGARVLVVIADEVDNPDYWKRMRQSRKITLYERTFTHLPALLTIERQAFWPDIFASPFKQPISVQPPYDQSLDRVSYPLTLNQLTGNLTDLIVYEHPFMPHWQDHFDYLMLLLPGSRPDVKTLMSSQLSYIDSTDLAALYSIRHTPDTGVAN